MARKKASDEVIEYVNLETGDTAGAYAGTEQEKVFRDDPDWDVAGRRPSTRTADPEPEPSDEDGDDGDGDEIPDMSGLSRPQLNELATARGVEDADQLPNMDAVRKAIVATYGDDGDGDE